VDADDYSVWKSTFGSTSNLAADGNGDRIVNAADYTIWRNNLGRTAAAGSVLRGNAPEPASLGLLAEVIAAVLLAGRRH
jgi:hypothetical protein